MKSENLIILAAAAAAFWVINSTRKTITMAPVRNPTGYGTAGSLNNGGSLPVTEVNNTAMPGQNGYGWRYFSDGTVIDPQGNYYVDGAMVWSPNAGQMGLGM